MHRSCCAAALLVALAMAMACACDTKPAPPTLNGDYEIGVVCDTTNRLEITRIVINSNETRVEMLYEYDGEKKVHLGVHPPTSDKAFYISSLDQQKRFRLIDVQDIPLRPKRKTLEEGEKLRFVLTFERIDDSMRSFHVIEGDKPSKKKKTTDWHFLNVKLPKKS